MQIPTLLAASFVASLLPSALAAPISSLSSGATATATHAPVEQKLKSSDHKKISKLVADYWDAKTEVKGIQAAFDKLISTVESTQSKIKDDSDILSMMEDWEQIFWMATEKSLDKPKTGRVTVDDDETPTLTYHVGRSYRSSNGPFPLLIIIPDEGQSPTDALAQWEDEDLRSDAILVAAEMDSDAGEWDSEAGINGVMFTYGRVARSNMFGFDFNRVFLAGMGKGFTAAATTASAYPHLFAGLIGRGDLADADPRNMRNLPSWLSSGSGADNFHGKVQELKYGNCTVAEDSVADIWSWMKEQKRNSYPQHISFWPPQPTARGTQWIGVDGVNLDGEPMVDAVVNRETNTITITAADISSVKIHFNDLIVDLSKPVKVVVNGIVHEELGARNRQLMVDLVYKERDWGRVFTRIENYDVPEKSDQ